ncbi:LOW QUALITY PROTEIN: UDP-N-acetylglucosamine transferase subunit ALG13-like [Pogona vitticeps]
MTKNRGFPTWASKLINFLNEQHDLVLRRPSVSAKVPSPWQVLQDLGYRKLVLQVGRGAVCPDAFATAAFTLDAFRFKNSISADVQTADLVISHAGAGSCLEVLEAGKPLLVVVKDKLLMDNHQLELAKQLCRDGHLFYCNTR